MKAKGKTGFLMAIWAGASFAGYNIGSGYATGVETMQFYVPWGKELAFVGIIFSMLFAIAMLIPLYMAGRENSMGESEIYEYFCGKKMGKFFEIYIYVNMLVIIFGMMSGSGATLNQYFGVPEFVGAIFMGAVSVVASLLNLEKLMKVLSYIGIVAIISQFFSTK